MANSLSDASEPRFPHFEQESFCTAVLEGLPEPVIACASDGELVYVNQRAREMTGADEGELVSVHFPELRSDAADRGASETLRESIGEAPTTLDAILHTESGRLISCAIEGSFVEQNGTALFLGIVREGAEQPRREDEVPDREAEFRYLVKGVKEYAIFMLDPEGHVTTWNEGAERIKGYTEEEIIGTHFSTFYPPEAVEAGMPARVLETAVQEGQWTGEGWRMRKDNTRFWAHVTVTALRGKDGAVRRFAKVTRDMTERHRRETELKRQKQQAEEAKQRAQRENALLRLMQTVAATANDADGLEEALQEAVDIICEHIDWPVGHVYWFDEAEEPPLIPSGIWCLDDAERFEELRAVTEAVNFAVGESLPGRVASTGDPTWIRDVTSDSNFVRTKRAQNLGVKGAFGVPIPFDGGIAAVLEFFSESTEELDEQLMEAMASVGVQLSRVAERERAQEALRRSEKRYRRLFETSQEGIVIQAADWTVTDLNPATEEILGYDREELIGRNPTEIFVNLDQYERAQQRIKDEGQFRNVEFDLRRRDGEVIVCEATSTMQREAADDSEMFYTIFRDITERKHMQEALEESEKRYRRLFEESRDAVVLTTPAGAIVDANSAAEELFGYSSEELLDMRAAELYADPEERARRIVPTLKEADSARVLEAEMRHCEGHTFPATASVTVHRDEEGHAELIQALVRDVTEWRRLEAELLEVQDKERQRLGQELHDGVCSTLTGVAIWTSALAEQVRADEVIDPDDLDKATELVKQASDEARAISHGLSPVGLERGLLSALEDLASQAEVRGELSCSFEASGSLPDLSEETATHLYRIVQEAVSNSVKHADAQHIQVTFAADDEALTLTVEDDGEGYSASSSEGEGIGMRTMRYRADLINAALTIKDPPDGGTRIRCRLPVPEYS